MKILILGETRGQWQGIDKYNGGDHDLVIHVGGLGLHLPGMGLPIPTPKLRHLTHFSPFDPPTEKLSQLEEYINGELRLEKPMYAIPSSIDDPKVITKFRNKTISVPNLHIVDDLNPHYIPMGEGNGEILVCGLPGMFSLHKLFHHSTNTREEEDEEDKEQEDTLPMSGDSGDVWVSILHIGQFLDSMLRLSEEDPKRYNSAIKVFLCNTPPFREPLLHHLAIMLKMDYTISASLFFKHTASFNNLTAHSSLEGFKQGFITQKAKLDRLLNKVGGVYRTMLETEPGYLHLYDLAVETWDKIPSTSTSNQNTTASTRAEANSLVRNINDLYYTAFHHEWHLNVSDPAHGFATFQVSHAKLNLATKNIGFDFSYRNNV